MVFIATRRIVRPPKKGSAAQRPRSRTLTAVHDAMLEDIVHPAEIVGKLIRYRLDSSKIIKVISLIIFSVLHRLTDVNYDQKTDSSIVSGGSFLATMNAQINFCT